MRTDKTNDCIAQSITHALRHFKATPDTSLLINDLPDIALPYAYIPQIAAHYGLYVTEVPKALPLHLLDTSCFFLIVYNTGRSAFHVITSTAGILYDPQSRAYVPHTELVGNVLAIYLCQPSLSLGEVYGMVFLAEQTLDSLSAQETAHD